MKVFRSVFALRLAIFPFVLNLTFSEEVIDSFWTSDNEVKDFVWYVEEQGTQDSSLNAQNDNTQQLDSSLYSEWQEMELFWTSDNEVKNLRWYVDEQNIQDSSATPQNDKQSTNQNDQQESEDSEDDDWWENKEPELIISEVYYDGKDERIEIFNIWSGDFYGDIELSWATAKPQIYTDVQIPANDFLIIANSNEMFDFEGDVNILLNQWNYKKFSITDTKEIQISLILSWEEVDSFFVHENRVKKVDNEKMSFQKVISNWKFVVTWSLFSEEDEDMKNIRPWFIANPWVFIQTFSKVKDASKDPDEWEEEEFESWDCEDVYQSPVTVSEVFRGGSRYDPYIEFDIHDDMEWYDFEYLMITWDAVKTPIYIDLRDEDAMHFDIEDLEKNTKLILTTKEWSLTEAGLITIVLHSDFELNLSGWNLELYWIGRQSRQLLDIVKIWAWISEKSVYRQHSIHQCGEKMDNVNDFSPGFDESALKYFSVTSSFNEKIVERVKYVWWWGGCSCPSKAELCWTATWDTQDSSAEPQNDNNPKTPMDSSDESSEWQTWSQEILSPSDSSFEKGAQIKIVSLEPKTPESITLQSFLPYDIDFKNHNYYLKTSTANSKKYIDGILYANTIDTFSKSFWFVDAGACVYLYSWDLQLDSYCYSSEKEQIDKEKKDTEIFNPSDYQISITHIDYDPDGSDTWNETITIQSNSSKPLDLSKIKMKVNATNKKLTGILDPHSSITLKWTFGFPNSTKDWSDVVVILFYENHIFATYTYNPNKPKVEIPQWAVKVYSVIDGDTFRYRKEDGSLQSVRLLGVDAPESNTARYRTTECFWKEAKNYLTNLIKNQYVTLEFDLYSSSSDAYGRMLAYVYLDGKLVNEILIAEWYAKEYTYKTPYTYQSSFRQAEENAKKSEKWLRSASTCWKSIAEEPEAWGIDYEKLSIKIQSVIYDPDGTDAWNETVQLTVNNSQISTVTSIDFSDDFSLTIFPRSEYATWTTKSKKLTEFWLFNISSSSQITLKWSFQLPNNRATCVSLNQWSYTFDTRCYNPDQPLLEELLTWNSVFPNVKIVSILPNPSWTDSWKEEITLLRTPSDDFPDYMSSPELSPDFSLLINWKTKKKLAWNLTANQSITIKWTFSLPNSASCVSLIYSWTEIDKFCYSKPSDGVKFNSDNSSVREIPEEELAIVKKITLVKQWDKLCISYNKTLFSCKKIPNSTTEKNKKQLSMQNTFISELEKYIKSNYSMLYYNSNIKDYFELHSSAKKAIKSWDVDFTRNERKISLTDIVSLFPKTYNQDAKGYFISQISSVMPEHISLALLQIGNDYSDSLAEKSDLDFLSLAE